MGKTVRIGRASGFRGESSTAAPRFLGAVL